MKDVCNKPRKKLNLDYQGCIIKISNLEVVGVNGNFLFNAVYEKWRSYRNEVTLRNPISYLYS